MKKFKKFYCSKIKKRNFKDLGLRFVNQKYEVKTTILKYLTKNLKHSQYRLYNSLNLLNLSNRSYGVRINSRCLLSGRSKGVFSFFGLSRQLFRGLALNGSLVGVRKREL